MKEKIKVATEQTRRVQTEIVVMVILICVAIIVEK